MSAENAYLLFVQKLLALSAELWRSKKIPSRIIQTRRFTESGWKDETRFELDLVYALTSTYRSTLLNMEETEECMKQLLANGLLKPPAMSDNAGKPISSPGFDLINPHLLNILLIPIARKLASTESLTTEQVSELFKDLKRRATALPKRVHTYPLHNFTTEVAPQTFGRLRLDQFTPEEKTELWNKGPSELSISAWNFSQTQFRLKGSYLPTGHVDGTILGKDVDLIISALRLAKAGDVGILWSCDIEEESPTPTNVYSGGVVQPNPVREFGAQYNLSSQDICEVQKNFAKLSELSKSSAVDELAISLRRFNQSYGRRDNEDRIIDLVIALEASLARGEKTELRYRLALRGAALLRAIQPPRETKVLLQAAYDVRSEIVHEGRHMQHPQIQKILGKLSPQITSSDFSTKCEDIVRKVLREYINQLGTTNRLDTINGSLEDSIVDGLN